MMLNILAILLIISSIAIGQDCKYKYFNDVIVNVTTVQDAYVSYTLKNCSISPEVLPEYTYEIVANDQNIPDISPIGVSDLSYVKTIIFNRDKIQAIRPNAFYNLPSLTDLNLDENQITEIWHASLSSAATLEHLSLRQNSINKIDPTAFLQLRQLKIINLNDNKLTVWNNQWFEWNNKLQEIHIKANRITFIPRNAFKNKMKLIHIDFSHNDLTHVNSEAFNGFRRLNLLNLSNNKLATIRPETFANFKPVNNNVTSAPTGNKMILTINLPSYLKNEEQVSDSTNGIDNFYLHANRLTYIPKMMLEDLQNTKYFSIHSNPFQCACERDVGKWAQKYNVKININSKSCLKNDNPICVTSTKSPKVCLEEDDDEVSVIYFKVYESVENATANDVTCF